MIYIHVPFCKSFCTYCGFYSERACPGRGFVEAVCAEAVARRDEIERTKAIDTLYFGGGTPSVLPPSWLAEMADACGGRRYGEWTVEVNPEDVTAEYAKQLREIGVNRVSMGVQSLDDGMLRWMNRRHDAAGARRAFDELRRAGFDNISVDVIFGVRGMDAEMLRRTLAGLLSWEPEHISAYQLSVEEGSALEAMVKDGRYVEASDEECRCQYDLLCSELSAAGFEHYEISNWARPGRRAVHNSAYWKRVVYVGLGPGAHSLSFSSMVKAPGATLRERGHSRAEYKPQAVQCPLDPHLPLASPAPCAVITLDYRSWNSEELRGWKRSGEVLTEEEVREERIMLGLRTAEGVPAELLCGECQGGVSGKVGSSLEAGLLVPSAIPGYLRIPESRWFTANDIISSLI